MLTPGLRTATTVVVAACWGAFVLTWLAGAYYNALRGPGERTRRNSRAPLIFQVAWARILGLVVVVVSTAFTLWARGLELVAIQVKLRIEERLMLAEFPDDYPDYRRRVPQLVPGLRLPHRATG